MAGKALASVRNALSKLRIVSPWKVLRRRTALRQSAHNDRLHCRPC